MQYFLSKFSNHEKCVIVSVFLVDTFCQKLIRHKKRRQMQRQHWFSSSVASVRHYWSKQSLFLFVCGKFSVGQLFQTGWHQSWDKPGGEVRCLPRWTVRTLSGCRPMSVRVNRQKEMGFNWQLLKKGEGGVQTALPPNLADIICEQSLIVMYRDGKTYELASNACVNFSLPRVKSVPNFTLAV